MKDHTFVPSILEAKASASLEEQIKNELQKEYTNNKSIASLLQDEEKNKETQEDPEKSI